MRKAILFFLAIFIVLHGNAGQILPEKFKFALTGGTNNFPLIYGGPYGLNLGSFLTSGKWIYRVGLNGNLYSTSHFRFSPPPKYRYFGLGIEVGVEKPLLSESRKWLINPAVMFYWGEWTEQGFLSTGNIRNTTTNVGVGPLLLIGRRINASWTVNVETSASIGKYVRRGEGGTYESVSPDYRVWKLFGLGVRYTFGVTKPEEQ